MKKLLVLLLVLAFGISMAGCGPASPAPESTQATSAAATTQATTAAPDASASADQTAQTQSIKAQKNYEIAVVAKQAGQPWQNIMAEGVKKAAADFGVNAYLTGPSEADPVQQVKMIEDLITKGVDALIVAPSDAKALEPVFAKAKDKNIPILTIESPGQKGTDWDYEMMDNTKYPQTVIDDIAKACGGKGGYVMYVGGLTVPLHNYWADQAVAYQKEKYPDMQEVTDRIPCAESIDQSYQKTLELLKKYPDLKGIIGWGSQGPIGAAQAVRDKGLNGKIVVTGSAVPSQAGEYLEDNSLTVGYLWNPVDSGYFGVYAAIAVLEGGKISEGATFSVPGSDMKASVKNGIIQFDGILTFTKDNYKQFNF